MNVERFDRNPRFILISEAATRHAATLLAVLPSSTQLHLIRKAATRHADSVSSTTQQHATTAVQQQSRIKLSQL